MSGRVLVVTYYFPPVGGIGVQRTLKYVTYLPRWGWQPVVVAPADPAYPVRDRSLMDNLPAGLEVYRTASLEPGRLPNALARRSRSQSAGSAETASDLGATTAGGMTRLLRKAVILWNRAWTVPLFPDAAAPWTPFAVSAGKRARRRGGFDVIYSSALPISAHIAAMRLKRATGCPWVADFRDPWIGNPFAPPMSRFNRWRQTRTERAIVEQADRVVVAVDGMRDMFAARYPDLAHKFVFIPNGYDRADLAGLVPVPGERGRFTVLFAGSLYRRGELEPFLAGVEQLVLRRPDLRARLRVQFVGRASQENRRIAATYATAGRIGDVISFEGFVPRPQALARMAGADALLQLMADQPGAEIGVGGKLFEYLALDRPILAVMPPGEGRRLVESVPAGRSADVAPGSVAAALERLLDDPPAPAPSDPQGRYDRVNLAHELAGVLDGVLDEHEARTSAKARRKG